MRIGRLSFGKAIGPSAWGYWTFSCGCRNLDLGRFYVTWLDKDCKCMVCGKYECGCKDV